MQIIKLESSRGFETFEWFKVILQSLSEKPIIYTKSTWLLHISKPTKIIANFSVSKLLQSFSNTSFVTRRRNSSYLRVVKSCNTKSFIDNYKNKVTCQFSEGIRISLNPKHIKLSSWKFNKTKKKTKNHQQCKRNRVTDLQLRINFYTGGVRMIVMSGSFCFVLLLWGE